MIISEDKLRSGIRGCLKKESRTPLNEWAGIIQFLEDLLGPMANALLQAAATAAEEAESEVTSSAKEEYSNAGVTPQKGVFSGKAEAEQELKHLKIINKIALGIARKIDPLLSKAEAVKNWQPKDSSEEANKEWSESEDFQGALALGKAAALKAELIKIDDEMGKDYAPALIAKWDALDKNSHIEVAKWLQESNRQSRDWTKKTLVRFGEPYDSGPFDNLDNAFGNIISNIEKSSADSAKENPEEYKKAKEKYDEEQSNKKDGDSETSEELTDEQAKDLRRIADGFQTTDDPEDLKQKFTNAVERAVESGFVAEEEAKQKLDQSLAAFEKYVETNGEEGIKEISNLGTEKLKDEKLLIRAKAKESLDLIIKNLSGKGSGKGGGEGDMDVKDVIAAIQKKIEEKRTPWDEQQLAELNDGIKQSNAPIFLKGMNSGELVGFKYEDEKLKAVLINNNRETNAEVDKNNINDIVAEVRKYIRKFLIKEYFSR